MTHMELAKESPLLLYPQKKKNPQQNRDNSRTALPNILP